MSDSTSHPLSDPISGEVRRVVSDVLGVPVGQLTAASSPETIEHWDSIQHLSIVLGLEQALGVQFDPEDMEGMRSVGAIEAKVRAKRG